MPNKLKEFLKSVVKNGDAQSIQVSVGNSQRNIVNLRAGKNYKYFDMASVTKALCTTPVLIQLYQEEKFSLDKTVGDYLGYLQRTKLARIPVRNLLNQTSGLVWWRPFYKSLNKLKPSERNFALRKLLLKESVKKNPKCVYSDLNFMLLGQIIEAIENAPLDKVFEKRIAKPLNLKNTFFNPSVKKSVVAPTERNFRGIVQGEVHDENAASFGGVSGHAGLFSTLEETAKMAWELFNGYEGKSKIYSQKALRKFAKRAVPKNKGDWALGFVIPSKPVSTGGRQISLASFGFTGFTGASIWIDTQRKAVVTILSNRTFPTRRNEKFKEVRKELHDKIWTELDGK